MANEHQRPANTEERTAEAVRAPSHAERCRTLAAQARAGTLCTIALDPAGYPYGSLVTVAIDERGRPLFFLSTLAEHTSNLQQHAEASVLLTEAMGVHDEPLALGRVTVLGRCEKVPEAENASARATFLAQQPSASYYIDFSDFAFYRLEPSALRYVGGFGRMSWVKADAYGEAEADPLATVAPGILAHMNADHADSVRDYAVELAMIPLAASATLTAVDRYGLELAAITPEGKRTGRLAFDEPVATGEDVRRAMIAMVQRARQARQARQP